MNRPHPSGHLYVIAVTKYSPVRFPLSILNRCIAANMICPMFGQFNCTSLIYISLQILNSICIEEPNNIVYLKIIINYNYK